MIVVTATDVAVGLEPVLVITRMMLRKLIAYAYLMRVSKNMLQRRIFGQ
jgi:hypothetical protein